MVAVFEMKFHEKPDYSMLKFKLISKKFNTKQQSDQDGIKASSSNPTITYLYSSYNRKQQQTEKDDVEISSPKYSDSKYLN